MEILRDDPIIDSMLRTGYPPWMQDGGYNDEEWEEEDADVFYGNETESF